MNQLELTSNLTPSKFVKAFARSEMPANIQIFVYTNNPEWPREAGYLSGLFFKWKRTHFAQKKNENTHNWRMEWKTRSIISTRVRNSDQTAPTNSMFGFDRGRIWCARLVSPPFRTLMSTKGRVFALNLKIFVLLFNFFVLCFNIIFFDNFCILIDFRIAYFNNSKLNEYCALKSVKKISSNKIQIEVLLPSLPLFALVLMALTLLFLFVCSFFI